MAQIMKKILILLIIAILCLGFVACNKQNEPVAEFEEKEDFLNISLEGLIAVLDAGHGGDDKGKIGISTGRHESDVNLEITKKLQSAMANEGMKVIMTRETKDMIAPSKEEDMLKREQITKDANADMFISIHQNSFEDQAKYGPQVFFLEEGSIGKRLAVILQEELNAQLEIKDPRRSIYGDYRLLKPGKQPSVIVECGFFSNPEEEAKLQTSEYQDKIVKAIIDGVKKYTGKYLNDNGERTKQ